MWNTKATDNNISVFVPIKLKDDKFYIPPLKRIQRKKKKTNFARFEKGKNSDIGVEISKLMSKSTNRL